MNTKDNGGPAYPVTGYSQNQSTGEGTIYESTGGMTLRAYIATHVLQAIVSAGHLPHGNNGPLTDAEYDAEAARQAITQADALLAELAK